ncbi:ATPase, T2SS/T4P/T4SS family [Haloferax sp. DFSO60]|uniref:ATPase, T2SS/T4P/T4SS family n=1 Tax=Haloferax sp. DFSO60 TaxID=3388652 RepID=UPI00397E77A9
MTHTLGPSSLLDVGRIRDTVATALGVESPDDNGCTCEMTVASPTGNPGDERRSLVVDADSCSGRGALATDPDCRAAVISALESADVDAIVVHTGGLEHRYDGDACALLVAAGRFAERVDYRDERLATRARHDPLAAAHEALGRAGAIRRTAVESGLAEGVSRAADYSTALRAHIGPKIARFRADTQPPVDARLTCRETLETGAVVRRYDTAEEPVYHLDPPESNLDPAAARTLAKAHDVLARGVVSGGERAPGRAVRHVADADDSITTLTSILRKHVRGFGILDDFFADPSVSDVYLSHPICETPIRVVVDGRTMRTNVRLAPGGAESLASRLRRESGSSFSRADPTLDAVIDVGSGRVRVAGVTAPASDGLGFAFRRHDESPLTLPSLVANGTLSAEAAALCSLAVERGASVLVAGARGAGKTTFLGSLLWDLPPDVRTVLIEDAPELPAGALQDAGRDVQALKTDPAGGPAPTPQDALHTALRLGDGALVVGEVRGDEAAVLFEAMRVGSNSSAALGTIHGNGAAAVRERVVSDLGVSPSSFATTDLVITCEHAGSHRVATIEEVRSTGKDATFETLFTHDGERLAPTGALSRGDCHVAESIAAPEESYTDVLATLDCREAHLSMLAETDQTRPADLVANAGGVSQ